MAGDTLSRILARSEQIARFTESGRILPEFAVRAVREVFAGPYRIIYMTRGEDVEVLRVWHAARPLADDEPGDPRA